MRHSPVRSSGWPLMDCGPDTSNIQMPSFLLVAVGLGSSVQSPAPAAFVPLLCPPVFVFAVQVCIIVRHRAICRPMNSPHRLDRHLRTGLRRVRLRGCEHQSRTTNEGCETNSKITKSAIHEATFTAERTFHRQGQGISNLSSSRSNAGLNETNPVVANGTSPELAFLAAPNVREIARRTASQSSPL